MMQTEFRSIPLGAIDEPEIAMRDSMDETALDELGRSMQSLGLLQPIGVIRAGDRYRVAYGHRRFLAAGRINWPTIDAKVFPEGTDVEEAIKSAENDEREQVNPGSQALYYAELLEKKCGGDVDRLCDLTRKNRSFVDSRLELLRDHEVLDAVRRGEITITVARELLRVKDAGFRRTYLDAAIRGGARTEVVRQWRQDHERFLAMQTPAPGGDGDAGATPAPVQPAASIMRCDYCGSDDTPQDMELIYRHRGCSQALNRMRRSAGELGSQS